MGVPLGKNVQFQLLWFGGAVSQLGSQLTTYAVPLLILAVTGSYFWAGVIAGVRATTLILAQMPAGVFVDRWDRGKILVWSQTTQAVAVAAMAANVVTGLNSVPLFLALAAVDGVCTAFAGPARTTAIKSVVPPEQLRTAFAQEEARGHVAWLAGPPLGAALRLRPCRPVPRRRPVVPHRRRVRVVRQDSPCARSNGHASACTTTCAKPGRGSGTSAACATSSRSS